MAKKNMLIITDASGEIIAAQVEESPTDGGVRTFILPAEPEHALHRVSDVPSEIYNLADPAEFHTAITRHFRSEHAKIKRTSAEELGIYPVFSRLGSEGKKAAQDQSKK